MALSTTAPKDRKPNGTGACVALEVFHELEHGMAAHMGRMTPGIAAGYQSSRLPAWHRRDYHGINVFTNSTIAPGII